MQEVKRKITQKKHSSFFQKFTRKAMFIYKIIKTDKAIMIFINENQKKKETHLETSLMRVSPRESQFIFNHLLNIAKEVEEDTN
jgi:hypothetical protein